jgi:hypothetical protein
LAHHSGEAPFNRDRTGLSGIEHFGVIENAVEFFAAKHEDFSVEHGLFSLSSSATMQKNRT